MRVNQGSDCMARKKRQRKATFINVLIALPWQFNAVLSLGVYFGMTYIPSFIEVQSPMMNGLMIAVPNFAFLFGLLFLVTTVLSAISAFKSDRRNHSNIDPWSARKRKPKRRKAVKPVFVDQVKQNEADFPQVADSSKYAEASHLEPRPDSITLELIQKIEWKRFEELCKAYLESKGGKVKSTGIGSDGGVDIQLFRAGSDKPAALVQCKAWNTKQVGVQPIRELFGVMAADGVSNGIFMITDVYSQDAIAFAKGKKLLLISGRDIVRDVLKMPDHKQEDLLRVITEGDYTTPTCPNCDIKLIARKVSKGKNAGNRFWGCKNYPKCRYKHF